MKPSKPKPKARFCTKCMEYIDENDRNGNSEYVMLIAKKGMKIKEFFIFHKRCWMEHFKELANLGKIS